MINGSLLKIFVISIASMQAQIAILRRGGVILRGRARSTLPILRIPAG